MPANGTWPCATCGTLVYLYEVRGDGCVDCPRVEEKWGSHDVIDQPPAVLPDPPEWMVDEALDYPEVRQ